MLGNIKSMAQKKTRELRPRRGKNFNRFGSKRVGVRQSNVNTYEV